LFIFWATIETVSLVPIHVCALQSSSKAIASLLSSVLTDHVLKEAFSLLFWNSADCEEKFIKMMRW
jgi:hypothetical protein